MKKNYSNPELVFVKMEASDIIITSGEGTLEGGGSNSGGPTSAAANQRGNAIWD